MGRDVKIGLALGLVIIVVAIVIFSVSGSDGPLPEEGAAQPASPEAPSPDAGESERREGPLAEGPGSQDLEAIIDPTFGWLPGEGPDRPAPDEGERERETGSDAPGESSPLVREPSGPTSRTVEHVVKSRDTLWDLAKRYYGDARRLSRILEANRDKLASPGAPLQIGMKLVIPDVPVEGAATASTDVAPSETVIGPASAETEYDTYTVRPGDTLTLIAQRLYGDDRLVKPIVRANPRLARNPDRIIVGWKLRIPKRPAGARIATRDID